MKSALFGALLGIALALVAIGSCSIHHRTGDYSCNVNNDCDNGRVCNNGFCIVPGTIDAAKVDGTRPPTDGGNNCPSPCTTCNTQQKTCTVNCMTANCTNALTCPTGYHCDFMCNLDNSCRNGIDCQQAASCTIACSGKSACQNVQCGAGSCDVTCSGTSSCRGILCGSSCACDVTCTGSQSCTQDIFCSSFACRNGSGCSSESSLCHSCP